MRIYVVAQSAQAAHIAAAEFHAPHHCWTYVDDANKLRGLPPDQVLVITETARHLPDFHHILEVATNRRMQILMVDVDRAGRAGR